jgi:molybdate transport repressor ModE-like protein
MSIDSRLIAHMLAIAEHGSISRAAEALHISQPALSNGIALLEKRLGVRVLERSRHGSKLTEYGKAVVRCAAAINSHINRLIEEVKVREAGGAGTLKIGMTPIVSSTFVPKAICDLMQQMPFLTMSIREAPDDQLTEMLTSGQIDLSICPIRVGSPQDHIFEEDLLVDPFSVIVRKGHRLSSSLGAVSVADIIDEEWILPHTGSAYRRHVEAIFLTCGLSLPRNSINTNSTAMTETLLLTTDRVAIMSDWVIQKLGSDKYARVALRDIGAPRTIGVRRLKNVQPSPPTEAFIDLLRQEASAIRKPLAASPSRRDDPSKTRRKKC